ncbi:MAG: GNAT family N-acetyltransferase [Williamsia sp.]|nr:GNAT family N-acetyltransferase [Williamsia sp.]
MVEIRKASVEDLDDLAIMFDLYRIFYEHPSDVEACKQFLQERMQNNQSVIYIAVDEGKAVGFTQLYPIFSSAGLKRTWLLNDIYVKEEARKKHVASRLLDAAMQLGKETNSAWLLLQTSIENYAAHIVYQKKGWERLDDIFYQFNIQQN